MDSTANFHPIRKNNKGSFSLFLALSLLVLVSLFSLGLVNAKRHIYLQHNYIKAYQCMKHTIRKHKSHTERLLTGNQLIRNSNMLRMIPQLKVPMESIKKLLQFGQEIIYLNYLKEISSYKYCTTEQVKRYLKSSPFKRSNILFFKREKDGTIKLIKRTYKKRLWFKRLNLMVITQWKITGTKLSRKTETKEI